MNDFLTKRWWQVIAMMGLIFLASTDYGSESATERIIVPVAKYFFGNLRPESLMKLHSCIRKGAHVTEYALLAFLVVRALGLFSAQKGLARYWRTACVGFVVVVAFAASDEFHQRFVPSRGASVRDVMIDATGAIVGLAIALLLARAWERWPRPKVQLESQV